MKKLTRVLIRKSEDSFLLSLELFNKPTSGYRVESFSMLFTNAWELLLKALIYEKSGGKMLSIFRKKLRREARRKSITIDEAVRKVFPKIKDPMRKNIEYISEIRNEAAHLIIAELNPYFSRVFQAGVLNYFKFLEDSFGIKLYKTFQPGLISLVSDSTAFKDIAQIKKHFNRDEFRNIREWIRKFKNLEHLGPTAVIPLSYSIAIVKNPGKGDVILSAGGTSGEKAIVINKYRDIDESHPHRRKDAMIEINKQLSAQNKITTHDFEAYCFANGIKKTSKNERYWKPRFGSGQFSNKFIDEISEALSSPSTRTTNRKQYSEHLGQVKKRRSK